MLLWYFCIYRKIIIIILDIILNKIIITAKRILTVRECD